MKPLKNIKRILAGLMAAAVAFIGTPGVPVKAAGNESILVHAAYGGTNVPGMEFKVYKVADYSESGQFTVSSKFAGYVDSVSYLSVLNGSTPLQDTDLSDSSKVQSLADTLYGKTVTDGIKEDATGKTDGNGLYSVTGLDRGVYLVVAPSSLKIDKYTYSMKNATLVVLPAVKFEEGSNVAASVGDSVTVEAKLSRTEDKTPPPPPDNPPPDTPPDKPQTVRKIVQKVWLEMDGNTEKRPTSIEVALIKDGEVAEKVTLSEDNNWRYEWNELDAKSSWSIAEISAPDGYKTSMADNGTTYVITNTRETPPKPPVEIPPGTPPEDIIYGPNGEVLGVRRHRGVAGTGRLPQTGQLWWPVPILLIAGAGLVTAGVMVNKKGKTKK